MIKLSTKDEEENAIFQKETLNNREWAMFHEKIGEKKRGYYFPKAADGNDIMTINNKLVYTNGNWGRPRIDRVIEIDVDGVPNEEWDMYVSFIQEDLIEYEKNGQEVLEDVQEHESKDVGTLCKGQVNIKTYYGYRIEPAREKEPDDQYNYMMKTIKFLEKKPDEQQLIEYLRANGVEI